MEIERDSGRFCKVPYMQRPYVKIERDLECFFNALYKRGHVVERHPDGTTASIPLLWVPTDGGDRCSIPFADLTADQTDKVNILLKRIGSRLSNVIVAGKPCAWCRIVRDENEHRLPWLHFDLPLLQRYLDAPCHMRIEAFLQYIFDELDKELREIIGSSPNMKVKEKLTIVHMVSRISSISPGLLIMLAKSFQYHHDKLWSDEPSVSFRTSAGLEDSDRLMFKIERTGSYANGDRETIVTVTDRFAAPVEDYCEDCDEQEQKGDNR